MKKKIIFVHIALWLGGIEVALINMLNRMDYEKYEVTCLIVSAYDDNLSVRITSKCRLIFIDRGKTISFSKPYRFLQLYKWGQKPWGSVSKLKLYRWKSLAWLRYIENYLYIRYINSLMGSEEYDCGVIFSNKVGELTIKAIKAKKYIAFYHHGALEHVYHDKIGYKKSSAIIAVSKILSERLKEFMPQYREKITFLSNITDVEYIRTKAEERMDFCFENGKFHIVSCGRLALEKGMDLAIDACAKIVRSGKINVQWWIIGEGPLYNDLSDQINKKGMDKYIHLTGVKDNPYPYIKNCNLYVQPSRIEAFGLTILEAMILGRPIISTLTDGGRELITDDVNGKLCLCDAGSIADTILKIMDDSSLRERYQSAVNNIDFEQRNIDTMAKLEKFL